MTSQKRFLSVAILALVLLTLPALAAEPFADVEAAGPIMTWSPLTASTMDLRITGPGDLVMGRTLSAEAFSLNVVAEGLSDGLYKWEVRVQGAKPKAEPALERRGLDDTIVPVNAQRGAFSVINGELIDPSREERSTMAKNDLGTSGCLGLSCPAAPAYGDSTLLLNENNLRIKFADDSAGAFPANDWEIEANSSANGGQSYLGFNDCGTADNDGGCATDLVFAVEAGARASALYVEGDGDIGIGTSNPVVDVHVVTGNTPTLRLEQDGSSGFAARTWDVAGNEAGFFVRDINGGSTLPFRILPDADSETLVISGEFVGIGTTNPNDKLDIYTATDDNVGLELSNNASATEWVIQLNQSTDLAAPNGLAFTRKGTGVREMQITDVGDLEIEGDFISNGTTLNVPDYVFADDYNLMPLDKVAAFIEKNSHLPNVPSANEINSSGKLNVVDMQMRLLEKIEELTLYTLEQQELIERLNVDHKKQIERLNARIEALESGNH